MSYEVIEKLKHEIAGFKDDPHFHAVGTVVEVGDGIARISGLTKAVSQELLAIHTSEGDIPSIAFSLEEEFIGAIILAPASGVKVGDRVSGSGRVLSIPVSDEILGRVVTALGAPADGKGIIWSTDTTQQYPLERAAPDVVSRESVTVPLHTGIKAVDAMIPIGRGQRELIIGDRGTGKTAIALDAILNQLNDKGRPQVYCVYVAVGQKQSKVAQIVRKLSEAGAMAYTTVVSAPAGSPAPLLYLAPFAGAAIGEYFMDQGKDVLVIYDDLSKHADAYREMSLLLRRSPGREAYPGDIFYLHSRLLERSAKLDEAHGRGSMTALPIIETKLGDVAAYIPTNVISITDGQIYLESSLFNQGVRPAVNVGLSVSRVGSSAQTKAMKKVAGKLRLELAQFRELAAFVQFASDLDEATREKIARGELLTELLKQPDGAPQGYYHTVPVLYAALNGYMTHVPKEDIAGYQERLVEYLEARHRTDVLDPIETTGNLDENVEAALKGALEQFKKL
ncbi:F0F1 ATP synthase subunit alpha [Candidatus Kaiserbacteria bacterium CG10_big_fil_rev_8_21_14_0_10_56_12]|uniref:ATP synthase subunit alpha n=1 Tax=Candidatus Kaiserbacteria bacterium CG10_big_fil_rev_8_21_14_0_10_56_12 TaxID=1974611 RepID=A0A2H0UA92_9BACT|nr:MAG: F0F1 ATP synthase subunit alpha [Candidatus Kaiserbacteria bacterium CG10_big_fil_rev_8_21_14_0_10_56_12]